VWSGVKNLSPGGEIQFPCALRNNNNKLVECDTAAGGQKRRLDAFTHAKKVENKNSVGIFYTSA
jgi:hypothetical protein